MVRVRISNYNGTEYVYIVHGRKSKVLKNLGKRENLTEERILFEKRKAERELNENK